MHRKIKTFSQFFKEKAAHETTVTAVVIESAIPNPSHLQTFERINKVSGGDFRIYYHSPKSSDALFEHSQTVKWARKLFPKYARKIMRESFNSRQELTDHLNEKFGNVSLIQESSAVISDQKYLSSLKRGESKIDQFSGSPFNESVEYFKVIEKRLGSPLSKKVATSESSKGDSKSSSTLREQFIKKEIFNVGDLASLVETGDLVRIKYRGSNYLVVERDNDQQKVWLEDLLPFVEELEKDDDDPCQDGWVMRSTKVKDGRTVPNCIPQFPEEYAEDPAAYRRKYSG